MNINLVIINTVKKFSRSLMVYVIHKSDPILIINIFLIIIDKFFSINKFFSRPEKDLIIYYT